jgi:multiple sugar transport system ATP-binding protein
MATVVLKALEKSFPAAGKSAAVAAVNRIDLEVRDGEFMVLVGPSGCGKTTTLRMIAGLEAPTAGQILIDGRLVNDIAPKDRDLAMVFQSYALYPHLTVGENLGFGLKVRRTPAAEITERVRGAAEMLGLTDLLDRLPKALSGGQRQRVALGRAIVRRPKVFLFDEPLSNLDAKMRASMRAEIAQLHHRLGATMIYVTHDQTEAMTLGDRICVMNGGVISQLATPLDVYRQPANRFTAGFIGSPCMNFLDGSIERRDGATVFRSRGGGIRLPVIEQAGGQPDAVTLGVRPEHLHFARPADLPGSFPATVELVEPLGAETLVHVLVEAQTMIIRAPADLKVTRGEQVSVHAEPAALHLFDGGTGKRITP